MQHRKAWLIALAVLGGMLWFSPVQAFAMSAETLITLTNQQRVSAGLSPLTENTELDASAQAKAQDMLAHNYWAHYGPDGASPWQFMSQAGYQYRHAGENLAMDFVTEDAVMTGWMNSPEHRANILNTDYQDIGIAVIDGQLLGEQTELIVAHYGASTGQTAPAPAPVAATSQSPAPNNTSTVPDPTTAPAPSAVTTTAAAPPPPSPKHTVHHKALQHNVRQQKTPSSLLQLSLFQVWLAPLFKYQG